MPDFRFQHRRTTTATADPDEVLLKGEWGIEFDDTTGAFVGAKMGDGVTAWSALPYLDAGGGGGTDDQTAVEVPFTPAGGLAATHVQAALEELDTEKQPLDAVLTATTASFTTTKDTKLTGIATGATANDTDANLRARSSHTGAQAISTVTGLQAALDAKVAASALTAAGKGYVDHGATAGTARPSGFASVEWYGSVEPTNAVDGDTWVDTSA